MTKKILLFMCMVVSSIFANASFSQAAEKKMLDMIPYGEKDNIDAYLYDTDGDDKADHMELIGKGKMKDFECTYTSIPYRAEELKNFCADIKTVEIGNGITSIGDFAFAGFTSLESIKMPTDNQLTSIGESAFQECSACKQIDLPNSISSIGQYAFALCYRLESINVPNALGSIQQGTFYECNRMDKLVIPASVKKVDKDAFSIITVLICDQNSSLWDNPLYKSQCISKDTFTYSAGDTLKYIFNPNDCSLIISGSGEQSRETPLFTRIVKTITFQDYTGEKLPDMSVFYWLQSVTVPEGITSLKEDEFSMTSELESIILPKSLKEIGKNAFYDCAKLKNITIPSGVKTIERRAFFGCESLESINLPEGIEKIDIELFAGCKSLKSITIPESVTWIRESSFKDCLELKEVYFSSKKGIAIQSDAFTNDKCIIYCYPKVKKIIDEMKLPGIITKSMCEIGNHILVKTSAKAVTKTEVGNTAYYHCTVCDHFFSDSKGKTQIEKDSWIIKLKQTITCKKIKKYSAKSLKKKKATFKLGAKASGNGKLSYKVTKGSKKYISVSKKGKVTLKKGCKKGTYKIRITANENDKYNSATKVVKIKVK